jgi:hypothetical protein
LPANLGVKSYTSKLFSVFFIQVPQCEAVKVSHPVKSLVVELRGDVEALRLGQLVARHLACAAVRLFDDSGNITVTIKMKNNLGASARHRVTASFGFVE